MLFVSQSPSTELAPFVSQLWYAEGPQLAHARERKLPTIGLQLLVSLHDDHVRWWDGPGLAREQRIDAAAVGGMHTQPIAISTCDQRRIVGAVLQPSAAGALLGVPAHELAETHTELAALWGRDARILRERMQAARSPAQCLTIFDRAIAQRIVAQLDPGLTYACAALARGDAVASVADTLSMDRKRLRRTFAAAVGIAPKGFARVARLQRLLRLIRDARAPRWAALAHDCGYYDQAHLIAEFRSLTGLTPTAYRPRTPDEPNHVVL